MEEIRDVFGRKILEIGEKDNRVVVLDADVGSSTRASMFSKIPERFVQCGIAEQNMVGISAGLALKGFIPVAVSFSTFIAGRCYDQIRVSIAYPNLNVKLVGSHAGLTPGPDGPTHQAIDDIALMRALPNMMVLEPADRIEMEMVVEEAIKHRGPVYIRINRGSSADVYTSITPKFKKINILKEGKDIAIIASGFMVQKALLAADMLKSEGLDVLVAGVHCIKPLDAETLLNIANKVRFIITVENHSIIGGLGSAVSEILSEMHPLPVFKMGIKDTFAESANTEELFEKYGLTEFEIVKVVKKNM
ncbi:MAG: transketolase family protein [Thermovenabulum sp.]|uniref:transketolase family protein n=2 Tax=Thermovenabulum sp. TaxID=3100335 RepID=UPI003C7D9824